MESVRPTLRERASGYLRDAAAGIRRAPVEVVATLVVAIAFSTAIEIGGETMNSWAETAVAAFLILVIGWTGTLLHEAGVWSARRRWLFAVGGAVVVAVYALRVADFTYDAEAWRAVLLVGAAVLWLFGMPAFTARGGDPAERMRLIDGRIVLRAVGALLYCGALFAGLALALAAVDSLFELELHEEIYAHVFGWIFFVLAPWIVLGGLPDYLRPEETPSAIVRVAQRIAVFLVPPLLGIYYVILYAYVVRILMTGELPKNLVSPLVLVAGILAGAALLVFDPPADRKPLSRALRLAPPLFLPLSVLGVWALFVRLDQYGLTEFRVIRIVALAALIALAVGATVQIVRRSRVPLHWGLILPAAAALLIAVGPWSAMALSKRSQQDRLERALVAVGIDPHDETYRAPDDSTRIVPAEHFEQISGSARYLASHFGPDALAPALWHASEGHDARWTEYAVELGLRPDQPTGPERFGRGGSLAAGVAVPVTGGTAYRISLPELHSPGDRQAARDVMVTIVDSTRVGLHLDSAVLRADLTRLAIPSGGRGTASFAANDAVLPLLDPDGQQRGELIVSHLWMHQDSSGWRVSSLEGIAIVRE